MGEEESQQQQGGPRRAGYYNPELVRQSQIGKLLEGKATLHRPTREMIFEEAYLTGLDEKGIKLKGCMAFCKDYREMSPGIGGKGIDGAIKVLSPVPAYAVPGSISDEDKVGFFARILMLITGKKAEDKGE